MSDPSSVEVSISGVLNGTTFSAKGTLTVDVTVGVKSGTVDYCSPAPKGVPGPDSIMHTTGKCFVGAKHSGDKDFLCPFELLGSEFVSLRLTTLGRYGTVSVSERARFERGVLHSVLTTVGDFKVPPGLPLGPLREVITVGEDGTMVGKGRYSYVRDRGRPIPVRYTHFYRSSKPHRSFARWTGRSFLLRAEITTKVSRGSLKYRSHSTIRPL
ncbi:MAG: hypothetical protein ABSA63_00785 [Thermoplasmata archaeon]|jgi:hypothetical protein